MINVVMFLAMSVAGAEGGLPQSRTGQDGNFVTTRDGRFVDQDGRHVILHGVNVGQKGKPYYGPQTQDDFARMREWGFNCVRLLVLWAGVEPECGKFDDHYLDELHKRVQWAKQNQIFVVLDMHQDLYGEKFSDGAPAWATLDGGKPHVTGPVWSDAYWTSQAVQAAFDAFWANKPAPDGVGLQDHYAQAWQHVAARFAGEPAVVGYDLMNEPFVGSRIMMAGIRLAAQLPKTFNEQGGPGGIAGVMQLFEDRGKMADTFNDIHAYSGLLEAVEPVFQAFERDSLMPMYQKTASAIRTVDRRHVIFIEPPMSANMGISSVIGPLLDADGKPDPHQALAPHAYDIVVDTPSADVANDARMTLIFERHQKHARDLNLPLWIGEWGAFYGSAQAGRVAKIYARLVEQTLAGDAYWDYEKNLENAAYLDLLARPYPQAVAGTLTSYHFDFETRTLTCAWENDAKIAKPTIIYVPGKWFPNGLQVTLNGQVPQPSPNGETIEISANSLKIHPAKTSGGTVLVVKPKPL